MFHSSDLGAEHCDQQEAIWRIKFVDNSWILTADADKVGQPSGSFRFAGVSEDRMVQMFGEHFFRFAMNSGYDRLLKVKSFSIFLSKNFLVQEHQKTLSQGQMHVSHPFYFTSQTSGLYNQSNGLSAFWEHITICALCGDWLKLTRGWSKRTEDCHKQRHNISQKNPAVPLAQFKNIKSCHFCPILVFGIVRLCFALRISKKFSEIPTNCEGWSEVTTFQSRRCKQGVDEAHCSDTSHPCEFSLDGTVKPHLASKGKNPHLWSNSCTDQVC